MLREGSGLTVGGMAYTGMGVVAGLTIPGNGLAAGRALTVGRSTIAAWSCFAVNAQESAKSPFQQEHDDWFLIQQAHWYCPTEEENYGRNTDSRNGIDETLTKVVTAFAIGNSRLQHAFNTEVLGLAAYLVIAQA